MWVQHCIAGIFGAANISRFGALCTHLWSEEFTVAPVRISQHSPIQYKGSVFAGLKFVIRYLHLPAKSVKINPCENFSLYCIILLVRVHTYCLWLWEWVQILILPYEIMYKIWHLHQYVTLTIYHWQWVYRTILPITSTAKYVKIWVLVHTSLVSEKQNNP